jgi:hypothetical protein
MTRKLPVWGSWNTGERQTADGNDEGYSPDWQLKQLRQGKHLCPFFEFYTDNLLANALTVKDFYYYPLWSYAKSMKIPIALIGRNFVYTFAQQEPWDSMGSGERHPFLESSSGTIVEYLSAFSDKVEAWYDLGHRYGTHLETEYASDYPDCPYIFLGDNNEVGWSTVTRTQNYDKYFPAYLSGIRPEAVYREMCDGYRQRQGRFIEGLNDACPSWAGKMFMYGYQAFGNEYGALESSQYIYRYPYGNILGHHGITANVGYLHDWSTHNPGTVRSPQVESCNSAYALEKIRESHDQDFKVETHFWNGKGVPIEPWRGVVRCVLWIMRTEFNRMFFASAATREVTYEDMSALIDAVEEVYDNPTLNRFWQDGVLLKNKFARDFTVDPQNFYFDTSTAYGHPYYWRSTHPSEDRDPGERWFLQHVPDNERVLVSGHQNSTYWIDRWQANRDHSRQVLVFAIALQYGEDDDYLIYAHAPSGELPDTEIQIYSTGYNPTFSVTVDVPVEGAFWTYNSVSGVSPL